MLTTQTRRFFDIIKARSDENEKSIQLLLEAECYALLGAIIRMELDSLIRVEDFNSSTDSRKIELLNNFFQSKLESRKWMQYDSQMVKNYSQTMGWAHHIYHFCCAFVHLSPYHDWASNRNITNLTQNERRIIVNDIKSQQYDPTLTIDENFGFDELIPFAPHIFKKLRDNLLHAIQ